MLGTQNLPVPRMALEVGLPVIACSHRMCVPGKAAFPHYPIYISQ